MRTGQAMSCTCCGANTTPRTAFVKNGYPILQCVECGVGSICASALKDVDLSSIYSEDYFSGGKPDGYANYMASEEVLRNEFRRTLANIRRQIPSGRLLEIGCAYGFFLMEAERYFECQGLELCGEAVESCLRRGLKVQRAPADTESILAHGKFDCVVMLDVIEHLPEPAETLRGIFDALSPGGVVYITTGDWNSPLAKLMGSHWRLMTPPQHLYFFTPKGLGRLLTDVGFASVTTTRPWKFVPLGLVLFQLCRILGLPQVRVPSKLNQWGIPINIFDTFAIMARKAPAS